jgi:integrase
VKGHTYKRCPCGALRDDAGRRINCGKRHGSWYYVHELPPDAAGTRRQASKGGFATERDARAALNELLSQLDRGTYVEPTKQTVGEYLEQWLDGKGRLRASTRRSYREHIELYLRPGLGHRRLSDLREVDIERLYRAMRQLGTAEPERSYELDRLLRARTAAPLTRPLTAARIRRVHATLMSALGSAVKRKMIGHNPATHVELAVGRRPKAVVWTDDRVAAWRRTGVRPPVAVWTAQQAGAFLDAAGAHRLYPMFHLIAYRGLRRGEAVGLRWQDLDLDAGVLRITQQVIQLGWATEIGDPKTDSGARTVTLDRRTVEVLRRWREHQVEERRTWGAAWHDTGLLFTREDGSQLHPDTATTVFEQLHRAAGLPPIRLHDLRHTAASLALAAGVPLKVVSEQLGHSSLAITADTYTSVLPAVAQAAAEAVADVIPRAPRAGADAAGLAVRYQFGPKEAVMEPSDPRNTTSPQVRGLSVGAPPGTRTPNPRIKSPLLCQLS